MKDIRLLGIVEDIGLGLADDRPKVNKHEVIEAIKNYSRVGKQLYNNNGIIDAAKQLAQMAESAQNHVLSETDDWFDTVSVKRNMKELKGLTSHFKKTAVEANSVNQRLSALYEDMGNILGRYYEVGEAHENGEHEPMTGGKKEYQKFFNAALKQYGVSSPDDLDDEKKKEFFNYVDKNWSGESEAD